VGFWTCDTREVSVANVLEMVSGREIWIEILYDAFEV
jgi:hypothetical protein